MITQPYHARHGRTVSAVTVLVPAHDEEATIAATVRGILSQQLAPDRVLVLADRCADATAEEAASAGAGVITIASNAHMKAGALNQVLEQVLPACEDDDMIAVIDADTLVSGNFLLAARDALAADPRLGGVSGVYQGKPGGGWAGRGQRTEFARWGFDARRQHGKAICLSGAASVFRAGALKQVAAAREAGTLPGGSGVYNTGNFTEDFELSQALLHLGWQIANLLQVSIITAVKPTWSELHIQRLRWNRGITETLLAFGLTRHTAPMWARWALYLLSVLAIPASAFTLGYRVASGEGFAVNAQMLAWIAVTAVISLHKGITAPRGRATLAGLAIVPELPYDLFLHATYCKALWMTMTNMKKNWR